MKVRELIEKGRERMKKFGIREWGMILLVGICFLVLVMPVKAGEKEKNPEEERQEQSNKNITVEESEAATYTEELEQRVEELLSCVQAVGKVKVMITVDATGEKNVLTDGVREKKETTEQDSAGGSRISVEERSDLETVFSGETPYLISESYPKVIGVVVIAEGSGTGNVDYDILQSVQVLFDLPAHKIKIMKMK